MAIASWDVWTPEDALSRTAALRDEAERQLGELSERAAQLKQIRERNQFAERIIETMRRSV